MTIAKTLLRATVIGALASFAAAQGSAADGDSPSYSFRDAPLNGQGVQALKDLRGKPVLVEFWGTR